MQVTSSHVKYSSHVKSFNNVQEGADTDTAHEGGVIDTAQEGGDTDIA